MPVYSAIFDIVCRLRAWKTNLLQVLQAVLFVFVIWAIDKAITYSRERQPAFSQVHIPSSAAVGSIPDCTQNQYLKVSTTISSPLTVSGSECIACL